MADTPLALLSQGAQVTADVFARIDRNLDQVVQVQAQAQQAEMGVRMKGLELAEQARMHDAQITQMNVGNYFRAKEFELREQMLPLQIANENLRIQAMQEQRRRLAQQDSSRSFDVITKDFDDQMGYNLLETANPDHAKAYLALKADWRGRVANGQSFNSTEFAKGVHAINEQYKNSQQAKDEGWNAETQYLYESISPSLGKSYQLKNPQVAKNRNALGASYYSMPDNQVGGFAGTYGNLFSPEELGGLSSGRTVYQTNQNRIDRNVQAANALYRDLDNITDEKMRADTKKRADDLLADADRLQKQNVQLSMDAAQGKFGVQYSQNPDGEMKNIPIKAPDLSAYVDKQPDLMGIPAASQSDPEGQTQRDRMNQIAKTLYSKNEQGEQEENELQGLDFKWFSENRTGNAPDRATLTRVRNRVENNIKSLDNIEERFTRDRVTSLLGTLNEEETLIPISKEFFNMAVSTKGGGQSAVRKRVNESPDQAVIVFGKPAKGMGSLFGLTNATRLTDYDDIQKYLKKFPTDAERKEAKEEIYAALITASLSHSIVPR